MTVVAWRDGDGSRLSLPASIEVHPIVHRADRQRSAGCSEAATATEMVERHHRLEREAGQRPSMVVVIDADTGMDMGPWGASDKNATSSSPWQRPETGFPASKWLTGPVPCGQVSGPSHHEVVRSGGPSYPIPSIPSIPSHSAIHQAKAGRWDRRQRGMWFAPSKHKRRQSVVDEQWGNDRSPSGISRPSVQPLTGLVSVRTGMMGHSFHGRSPEGEGRGEKIDPTS